MRKYDVKVGGQIRWEQSEEEIVDLYSREIVTRDTACRIAGTSEWKEVNEFFPTLKYHSVGALIRMHDSPVFPRAHAEEIDRGERKTIAPKGSIKVGLVCFGLGLIVAWICRDFLVPGSTPVTVSSIPAMPSVRANQPSVIQNGQFYANPPPPPSPVTGYTTSTGSFQPPQADTNPPQQPNRVASPPPTRECVLRLDESQWLTVAGRRIRILLHDYGPDSIGVQIDGGQAVRLKKQINPDPLEMAELTLIYETGSVKVYHLAAARAPMGCYLVRIVGDGA